MLDAYAIRKAIPRVVIAVIAINISLYLCVAAIDITKVVADSLHHLLVNPFLQDAPLEGVEIKDTTESGILGLLGLGALGIMIGGVIAGGLFSSAVAIIGMLLPLIVTISLIALAVLFTLVIRQGLLVFLSVISPIAIVCYILPGTEKYAKQWWDLFLRTLMVYPIVAAIFAMSNVMSIILLRSANEASMIPNFTRFAQDTPDGAATLQLVAAIIVMYAPLVLVPFAFKLAGGALATVMNAAQSRAAGLAGKAGDRIRKNREDQNTFMGKHTAAARGRRAARGYTAGAVMTGLEGGTKSMLRGDGFGKGFRGSRRSLAGTKVWSEADQVLESEAVKAISGNDDQVWAWNYGKNEADVRQMLQGRGYTGASLDMATAAVMRAKSQGSSQANKVASARSQAKTGTGYDDVMHMQEDIWQASGGDMSLFARMQAEMRGSAVQAGRVEQGIGSFNEQMMATFDWKTNKTDRDGARNRILDSVIDSAQAGQALYGKPRSAEIIATQWKQRHEGIRQELKNAEAAHAAAPTQATAQRLEVAKQDYIRTAASISGLQEAMNAASPQNARKFSNELTGTGLQWDKMSNFEKEIYGSAFGATPVKDANGNELKDAQGNVLMKQPADTKQITMMQGFGALKGNAAFQTMRKEYQDVVEGEAAHHRPTPGAPSAPGGAPTGMPKVGGG